MHFLPKSFGFAVRNVSKWCLQLLQLQSKGGFACTPGGSTETLRGGGIYPSSPGEFIHLFKGIYPPTKSFGCPGSHHGGQHPLTQPGQSKAAPCTPAVLGQGSLAWQGLPAPSLALPRGDPWHCFPWLSNSPLLACTKHALLGCFQSPRNPLEQQPRLTQAECAASAPGRGARSCPPLLCLRVLQPSGGRRGRKHFFNAPGTCTRSLQPVVSLVQKASVGWGFPALGEHPPPRQPQGVLGLWPYRPARVKIFEEIPCLARGRKVMCARPRLESVVRLWHVLCSSQDHVWPPALCPTSQVWAPGSYKTSPAFLHHAWCLETGRNGRPPALTQRCRDVVLNSD